MIKTLITITEVVSFSFCFLAQLLLVPDYFSLEGY